MKKKTGIILAAAGTGIGFLAGRLVEKIVTAKDLADRIEDMGGSEDLEDYLCERYGADECDDCSFCCDDDFYDDEDSEEDEDEDDEDTDSDENAVEDTWNKTLVIDHGAGTVVTMTADEFEKFLRDLGK